MFTFYDPQFSEMQYGFCSIGGHGKVKKNLILWRGKGYNRWVCTTR